MGNRQRDREKERERTGGCHKGGDGGAERGAEVVSPRERERGTACKNSVLKVFALECEMQERCRGGEEV